MTFKTIFILWAIAIALGFSVIAIQSSQNKENAILTSRRSGDKILPNIELKKLSSVTIQNAEHQTTLIKKNKRWLVGEKQNFPADSRELSAFLTTLLEAKITQSMEAGLSYNSRFGLDPISKDPEKRGISITLSEGNKTTTTHLGKEANSNGLGNNDSTGNGRYLRLATDPEAIYTLSETFQSLSANPADWLTQDAILQIENIQSITLSAPSDPGFESWTLKRKTVENDLILQGLKGEQSTNTTETASLKNLLANPRFVDVLSKEEAQEKADDPRLKRQATIKTFDNFIYTLDIRMLKSENESNNSSPGHLMSYTVTYKLSADKEEAQLEDENFKSLREKFVKEHAYENLIYQLNNWDLQSLIKDKSAFIQKPEAQATAPAQSPETSDIPSAVSPAE